MYTEKDIQVFESYSKANKAIIDLWSSKESMIETCLANSYDVAPEGFILLQIKHDQYQDGEDDLFLCKGGEWVEKRSIQWEKK